jgi:gentisate 1,2-dioxygenase
MLKDKAIPVVDDSGITEDARYFEYSTSANPIAARLISRVPFKTFSASLYEDGPTRVIPLDVSAELNCAAPATGPGLLASFVRVVSGEELVIDSVVTSQVFYVISGAGVAIQGAHHIPFSEGAFFTLPGGLSAILKAESTVTLYYVTDAPLMTYLGVSAVEPRFSPTSYPAERAAEELLKVSKDPSAHKRSRVSVLLGNEHFGQTRTVTHVLWAMFGLLPGNSIQKPHRHQSIALDFIVDCPKGCYSLVGTALDKEGSIVNPTRVDWEPGMAFITPPGYWHAHFNESKESARLIPIQDAGLQTYLRALDIRFAE